MADKTKKAPTTPVFRVTVGRINGKKYAFSRQELTSLQKALDQTQKALKDTNVKEVILTVR